MKKMFKPVTALLLSAALTLSYTPFSSYAKEPVSIVVDSETGNVNKKIGDVTVNSGEIGPEENEVFAVDVNVTDGKRATVKTGSITNNCDAYEYENEGDDYIYSRCGLNVCAEQASSLAEVTVNGDIITKDGGSVLFFAEYGGTVKANMTGNVISKNDYGVVLTAKAEGKKNSPIGTNEVQISGDIDAFGDSVCMNAFEKSKNTLILDGNALSRDEYGINMSAELGGYNSVFIAGDVTGYLGVYASVYAEEASNKYSENKVVIRGNVTGNDNSALVLSAEGGYANGNNQIFVAGDVIGAAEAIYIEPDKKLENLAVVEGTIKGKRVAVSVSKEDEGDPGDVYAWKILPNEFGRYAAYTYFDEVADEWLYENNQDLEKHLHYLIRVNQPAGATLKLTDANGNALKTIDGAPDADGNAPTWQYADAGDIINVVVEPQAGYEVAGVFTDVEQLSPVAQNESGNYSFMMVPGGGITVSAVVQPAGTVVKPDAPVESPNVSVTYATHRQTYGWEDPWKNNGEAAGTMGESKRLEAIEIAVTGNESLGIQYTTHCQTYGWLPWSANGEMSGTFGESKRLEAIKIQLTGADKDKYDVYYRVHAQNYGWMGWASNGEIAGTAGESKRLEAIQIIVVKKGEVFDVNCGGIVSTHEKAYEAKEGTQPVVGGGVTDATNPQIAGADTSTVMYRTHVQTYGWQNWKANGEMSGTAGESKRLEAINIKLSNKDYTGGICYNTHVQTYGWQGDINNAATWKKDGELCGTSGESKRLEAIQLSLYGEMAEHYDIYYRVHAQTFGWLNWAKNGEMSGTAGYSKRLEGIQIVLVPKDAQGPVVTYNGITSTNENAFIQ